MNVITIVIWIAIVIVAIVAIIFVKKHYNSEELENDDDVLFSDSKSINKAMKKENNKSELENNKSKENPTNSLSKKTDENHNLFRKSEENSPKNDNYIAPEVKKNKLNNFEYESQNQILINYDNKIKKFQEPIKQSQIDIMTQLNKNKDTELKDLFTIDELIKESKRKDSQREKESKTIPRKEKEDKELDDIKKSIESRKRPEKPLIEDVIKKDKEETIGDLINSSTTTDSSIKSSLSQTDIDNAIRTATIESENKKESVESENIKNTVINQTQEEIKKPALKSPHKVEKDYETGDSIDDNNMFDGENIEEAMDLDYRKDLDKLTNKIKGSKLFQEFKEKINPEIEDIPEDESMYIRNVNEYDDDGPIVNETHIDYESKYGFNSLSEEEHIRQENTKKVFNNAKSTPKTFDFGTPSTNKTPKDSIVIKLNNNEVTLKKGDEIIFNHMGETYSSQVYAIKGNDISVKYRRKNVIIKPNDVKKIY